MAISTIIANSQNRVKDSYASSAPVGLCLRSNGEETVKVIDAQGTVYLAGITAPTVAPTLVLGGVGFMTTGKWIAYKYAYASAQFPFVESDLAINGQLFPRSNPSSRSAALNLTTGGNVNSVTVTVTGTTAVGIDTIWVFRTAYFGTQIEAETAADANAVFFVKTVANPGAATTTVVDTTLLTSIDQIQSDNYVAPQFQFCVYYDPYWWGIGNLPFVSASATTSWSGATPAVVTIGGTDKWFDGRNTQIITFAGVTTGGFDGKGSYKFLRVSATTCNVTKDGITPVAITSGAGTGAVTIQGVATTLYRSKPRNPFSWGFTETIGDVNVPQLFALKLGGGLTTALAVVPNNPTLKIDAELPTQCYTLNLRSAGTSAFSGTLRIISDVYSVSSHWSQFSAVTQQGNTVLWGIDFKNFVILQSDGVTQMPISGPIPKILRALTQDRTRQLLTHGIYDPKTEMNCIWVSSVAGLSLVNTLIYCHAPTSFWGFSNDIDVLSSASIQDTLTGERKTFVGTQTGFLGQALVQDVFSNWLPPTGAITGTVTVGAPTAITTAATFNIVDDGIIGNWCLLTDANGQHEQWARISLRAAHSLVFDWIRSEIGGGTAAFNPIPVAGWKFYIGLIECSLLKSFDFNVPQTDKRLMELWLTQQNVDAATQGTFIRMYREREQTSIQFVTLQDQYADTTGSDVWFQKTDIPSELMKSFSLQFINRGYLQWRFINLVLKPNVDQ